MLQVKMLMTGSRSSGQFSGIWQCLVTGTVVSIDNPGCGHQQHHMHAAVCCIYLPTQPQQHPPMPAVLPPVTSDLWGLLLLAGLLYTSRL